MTIATGIVRDGSISATVAAKIYMPPQSGGSARLDILHCLLLLAAEGMVLPVVFAIVVKDLCNLKRWSFHDRPSFKRRG
jgi:hypothetical protein